MPSNMMSKLAFDVKQSEGLELKGENILQQYTTKKNIYIYIYIYIYN